MASGAGYRHSKKLLDDLNQYMREMGPGVNRTYARLQRWASFGSTIHLVSNCEDVTDWDISSTGNFNAVNETTDIRIGSNAIELVDAGTTKGTFVTLDSGHRPDDEDWSEMNWLCMWLHDDTALRLAGELTIQIRNNGDWCTALSVPVNQTADMWELKCIDISGLARNHVDGFRLVNQRGTGSSEKVYVDQIFVTDLISGNGDSTQIATGPVFGSVRAYPVTTGQTIVGGDTVEWSVMSVSLGTAADIRIIGVACQAASADDSRVASDTVPNQVLVAGEGTVCYFRNDGTGMAIGDYGLLGTNVVTEAAGGGTADAEQAFCMSLETSTGAALLSGDSAYQITQVGAEA